MSDYNKQIIIYQASELCRTLHLPTFDLNDKNAFGKALFIIYNQACDIYKRVNEIVEYAPIQIDSQAKDQLIPLTSEEIFYSLFIFDDTDVRLILSSDNSELFHDLYSSFRNLDINKFENFFLQSNQKEIFFQIYNLFVRDLNHIWQNINIRHRIEGRDPDQYLFSRLEDKVDDFNKTIYSQFKNFTPDLYLNERNAFRDQENLIKNIGLIKGYITSMLDSVILNETTKDDIRKIFCNVRNIFAEIKSMNYNIAYDNLHIIKQLNYLLLAFIDYSEESHNINNHTLQEKSSFQEKIIIDPQNNDIKDKFISIGRSNWIISLINKDYPNYQDKIYIKFLELLYEVLTGEFKNTKGIDGLNISKKIIDSSKSDFIYILGGTNNDGNSFTQQPVINFINSRKADAVIILNALYTDEDTDYVFESSNDPVNDKYLCCYTSNGKPLKLNNRDKYKGDLINWRNRFRKIMSIAREEVLTK